MTSDITSPEQSHRFLDEVGRRCAEPADLYLFGGSALLLLGGGRHTGDLDFSINTAQPESLRALINAVADELGLDVEESVPSEFTPLPSGSEERHRLVGHFGLLTALTMSHSNRDVMVLLPE
jgi:hypothetical protein